MWIGRQFTRVHAGRHPASARGLVVVVEGDERVDVTAYDVSGTRVPTLAGGRLSLGTHVFAWDGLDDHGGRLHHSVYWVHMRSVTSGTKVKKVVVMK